MYCQKCGKVVGDSAKFCISCGAPIPRAIVQDEVTQSDHVEEVVQSVEETKEEPMQTEQSSQQEYPDFTYSIDVEDEGAMSIVEERQAQGCQKSEEQPIYISNDTPPEKKHKKLKLVPVLICCFILLVGTLGVAKGAEIRNFIEKTVSSPKTYYKKVEGREIGKVVKCITDVYGAYTKPVQENKKISGKVDVKLDEGAKSLLSLAAMSGVDLTWLEKCYLTYDLRMQEDAAKFSGALGLKDTGIVNFDAIVDLAKNKVFIQVPELNKQYVSTSWDSDVSLKEAMDEYLRLIKQLPKSEDVETLLNRYVDIVLDNIDDVKTKKDSVTVKGVTESATKITVTIDGKQLLQIMIEIMKELQTDKEFKELYESIEQAFNEENELGTYDEFIEEVKRNYEELKEQKENLQESNDESFSMDLWVNDCGEVIGREVNFDYGAGLYYMSAESGSTTATEINLYSNYDNTVFEGKGKKSGNKVTGNYSLSVSGKEVLTFKTDKLDVEALKNGEFDGKVRFGLGQSVNEELQDSSDELYNYSNPLLSGFTSVEVECDGKLSAKGGKVTSTIYFNNQPLLKVNASSNIEKSEKFGIPKESDVVDSEDYDAMQKWEADMSMDKITKNLKKAGVPQEIIDLLEGKVYGLDSGLTDGFGSFLD